MAASTDRRLWIALALRVVLPSALGIILFSLAFFVLILPAFEDGLLTRKKEMLRSLTQTVCGLLEGYEERARAGEFTQAEAQARALRNVRRLRYGEDGKDYFWINDMQPRMIVHPYQPSLEGTDLTDYQDPHGKRLFVESVEVVRRAGSGYITYMWQWKDDPTRVVPKLSFVRGFKPWGWIVGTGVYLEDVAAEVRSITRKLTLAALAVLALVAGLSSYVVWHGYQAERQRQRAAQERAELQEQLHQAQKMEAIGQLAGGVAHDFNNLLTVISGNTQPLARALPAGPGAPSDAGQALEAIQHAVDQAAGLTRALLTFSQKLPANKQAVDLCGVVDTAARLFRHALPKTIRLVVDTGSAGASPSQGAAPAPGASASQHAPAWIYADANQLQQVLLNLALNARDAMPAGGMLRIAVSRAAGQRVPRVRLAVSDTGTGMSPAIQARIFEPFFTTKERGQGTGLGLAMVHGIVSEHGGTIEVQSTVGVGTTFIVTFPEMADQRAGAGTATRGRGELVLLAESNQPAREIMAAELRALGYEVTQVGDEAALRAEYQRRRAHVRLVILDLELPGRGGLECLRELRAAGGEMPVVLTVGSAGPGFREPADPAAVVLSKPFQMAELGRLVAALLTPDAGAEA